MEKLTDLFVMQAKVAKRLYSIYLSLLLSKSRHGRVVKACRRIRTLARQHGHPRLGDFTHHFELDALCDLGDFSGAWRVLRRMESLAFGRQINLQASKWRPSELDWFLRYHPHILYFRYQYKLGCRLYEAALSASLAHKRRGLSYDLLGYVYSPVVLPRRRQEVTLSHFYRKLRLSLRQWPLWEQFVKGFHARLFEHSGIGRQELLRDPSLLEPFFRAIQRGREERLTAGVSLGETELVDSSDKVRSYQKGVVMKNASRAEAYSKTEPRIGELFPELQESV